MSPEEEYVGLKAEVWDVLRGDTSGWPDRALYLELITELGEPVLDVGCGTGRLLLDYLSLGIDIDGVDSSADMLELCRHKAAASGLAPQLFQQRMQALDLHRRYRTVLVPSSSFQLVTDETEARVAMARLARHVEAGGGLVMPFMVPPPASEGWSDWHQNEATRPDGGLVRRQSRTRHDYESQLTHTEDVYEVLLDGEVVRHEEESRSPETRWYTQEQARGLYESVGLTVERVLKAFTQQPAIPSNPMFTVVGRRL